MAKADTQNTKGDIWWQSARAFGQENNPAIWRLARMNLAIRSIEGNLGLEPADSFHHDVHKNPKASYISANAPTSIPNQCLR